MEKKELGRQESTGEVNKWSESFVAALTSYLAISGVSSLCIWPVQLFHTLNTPWQQTEITHTHNLSNRGFPKMVHNNICMLNPC